MFAPALPIVTERLLLRPYAPGDLDALVAMRGDERVVRYLPVDARSRAELAAGLPERSGRTRLEHENDFLNLVAVLPPTGAVVAELTLIWRSVEHRQGEVGYIVHPAHVGHGYATEGARAMLALGFEGLDLHRIVGRIDARNTASARVLERLGMRREAHLVENERMKGEWTEEVVYALLAREWRTRT